MAFASYVFTYGRGVGPRSQAVWAPCHCTFSETKLEVYKLGSDGTVAQHTEGELSLVEYPRTRENLAAGLEAVMLGRGGAMRVKAAAAPAPAPAPMPSLAPARDLVRRGPLHAFGRGRAAPAPAPAATTAPPVTPARRGWAPPIEEDSPYRSRSPVSPAPGAAAAAAVVLPSFPVVAAPVVVTTAAPPAAPTAAPAPVTVAAAPPAAAAAVAVEAAYNFEAVIKSVHAWGYFGRREHGERDVMLPSSNFWALFSNIRAGVRPSVGMRVRGHVAPPPQNKAERWWLA